MTMKALAALVLLLLVGVARADADVRVQGLQVEYRTTPLGIDVAQPRFSWQMAATAGERGVVADRLPDRGAGPEGRASSGTSKRDRRAGRRSAIMYAGSAAEGRDAVRVDGHGLDPGGRAADREFVVRDGPDGSLARRRRRGAARSGSAAATTTSCCTRRTWRSSTLTYAVTIAPGSTRASFVYGANDSRLMDRNKNIYQLESAQGPAATSSWNSTSRAWTARRTARRSCTSTASATRTPTRPRSRSARSRSRPTVINAANKHAEHVDRVPQRVRADHRHDRRQAASLDAGGAGQRRRPPADGFGRRRCRRTP